MSLFSASVLQELLKTLFTQLIPTTRLIDVEIPKLHLLGE